MGTNPSSHRSPENFGPPPPITTKTTSSDTICMTSASDHGGAGATSASVRKRSRASSARRAKPTTILTANPSNFRALVQHFTGRDSDEISIRRRGPMTLDFGSSAYSSGVGVNYGYALDQAQPHRQEDQTGRTERCHRETTPYQTGGGSSSNLHGGYDHDHDHYLDHHDVLSEQYNSGGSNHGMDHMGYDNHNHEHHDVMMLEELMMMDDLDVQKKT
ncbi:PREDICTED: uncharacterized protein LOC104806977 [Tarenaya hassleriana]|uniref:uncharacterized protein LOC104806977 n=1 Tax=Tarenaya hassleriana TaxID=28532 RepID=UPI00053C5709|nr:PREDICTED: uncharacterized protein LOC104806977 [Tarenaya hassleriana]